jgi:hypothetical protein
VAGASSDASVAGKAKNTSPTNTNNIDGHIEHSNNQHHHHLQLDRLNTEKSIINLLSMINYQL